MSIDWQNSPPAGDYEVDELMIATLAGLFRNDDQVCNGMASFIPVAAFMLARLTHAPELVWLASAAGLDRWLRRRSAPGHRGSRRRPER